ncbi:MAG TPA: UDP-N-acetylmuramoyl-tripeptide--D-alanyl-D-alanine ligase [Sphaerochaetaceae bacterium]|nr:UDP-N-acetylmuramoyl-tripeptide--D-alanyl-D-alanine ligase [Sphaerochaetaceae bacterium]
MKSLDIKKVAHMAGGTLVGPVRAAKVNMITIDSRTAGPGALFVALPGAEHDGHDYVAEAFKRGATAALIGAKHTHRIKAKVEGQPGILIVVEDPLTALQRMAQVHVSEHPGVRRIGVTGSCGKTTTKEMIAAILSTMGKTAKTPGNYNSEIGLPISVFEIDKETEFGVFEMGVDHVGEMDRMLDIWSPEAAVITNIGISHVGKMGSVQVIAKEKSKLFHKEIDAPFLVENSAWSRYIGKIRQVDPIPFGMVSTSGVDQVESLGLQGWKITYLGIPVYVRAVGKHNLMNALAAISVAQRFEVRAEDIAEGFNRFITVPGRSRIVDGAVTVIEDYYNSSVDSTATILDYMGTLPWHGRKRAVLGSMKELGEETVQAHRQVARKLLACSIDDIYLFGKEMESAWNEMRSLGLDRNVFFTEDYDELQKRMLEDARKGDLVLVKGSRAMAMERLVPVISSIA